MEREIFSNLTIAQIKSLYSVMKFYSENDENSNENIIFSNMFKEIDEKIKEINKNQYLHQ